MGGVFGFDSALLILKSGGRVTRMAWGGRGKWLSVTEPSAEDRRRRPITAEAQMVITTSHGHQTPAELTQSDLLGNDWLAEHVADLTALANKETK